MSKDLEKINTIERTKLINAYKKIMKINIQEYINDDVMLCKCRKCGLYSYFPEVSGDEKFYKELQKYKWYYMDDKWEFKVAKSYIKNTDKVLEIGSGKGAFAKIVSNEKSYVGLEFSPDALLLAKENGITLKNEIIEIHAKYNKEKYDVVCAFQVLEHISDINSFIENALGCLKVGGLLIISVPNENSYLKYHINGLLNMPPHHLSRWPNNTFKKIENFFNLQLIFLKEEKLNSIHNKEYFLTAGSLMLGINNGGNLDDSLRWRIVSKAVSILENGLKKIFMHTEMRPNGHTVIAVYKKI